MDDCIGKIRLVAFTVGAIITSTGCSHRQPLTHTSPPSTRDAGAVPPGCSPLHGGVAASPSRPPRWQRGAELGATSDSSAQVILYVVSARDSTPVAEARIFLGPMEPRSQAVTDATGYARLRVVPGRIPVTVFRVGFQRYTDTVSVRGGHADTLQLALGTERICFM